MMSLAQCYETGTGCEKDISGAIDWYEKAAGWGDHAAAERLVILVSNPSRVIGLFEFGFTAPAA